MATQVTGNQDPSGPGVQQMIKHLKSLTVSGQKPKMLPPLTKAHPISIPKSKK